MRRGRPTNLRPDHPQSRPSPSPGRVVANDPFAALDSSGSPPASSAAFEEASQRFPSLDQFSLLHENGGKFAFEPRRSEPPGASSDSADRTAQALADEAFATASMSAKEPPTKPTSMSSRPYEANAGTQTSVDSRATPMKSSAMVSTGTMTAEERGPELPSRPAFRLTPSELRSSSQPRPAQSAKASIFDTNLLPAVRPSLMEHRSKSQTSTLAASKAPAFSHPSLESERPSRIEAEEVTPTPGVSRTKSRPVSSSLETAARFLRARSPSQGHGSDHPPNERRVSEADADDGGEATNINSNVEFLKAMEGENEAPTKRKEKRLSSGSKHGKRASMPSISLSGTKSLLAGRFGEAFRRFESGSGSDSEPTGILDPGDALTTPTNLTPIAGSEATDGRSDDGQIEHEADEAPPEVRRELERRRLSEEERRVANAAAAYKQQLAAGRGSTRSRGGGGGGDNTRATIIQNKVQALLDETSKASPTKTAEGYGRYTDSPRPVGSPSLPPPPQPSLPPQPSPVRKPLQTAIPPRSGSLPSSAPPAALALERPPFARPSAPPKPQALRTGGGRIEAPAGSTTPGVVGKPAKLAAAKTPSSAAATARPEAGAMSPEDWEANFSKRYPSLAGLEMVETEIDKGGGAAAPGINNS